MNGVSVLICTHNGKSVIGKSLEYLSNQMVSSTIGWEVLVIDNASSDNTDNYCITFWKSLNHQPCELRVVKEKAKGKINAIYTGVEQSKYSILLLCDDDNLLSPNYVQNGYELISTNNKIGCLGGFGIPIFEKSEPIWFKGYSPHYAVGHQGSHGDISNSRGWVYGAGSFIRKSSLININKDTLYTYTSNSERAEDIEICYRILLNGYLIWYDESLIFQHFISEKKLQLNYLKHILLSGAKLTYKLDGLSFRANANIGWFKYRFQRNWIFRFLFNLLDYHSLLHLKYLPYSFALKLYFIRCIEILNLNFKYDKSFKEN